MTFNSLLNLQKKIKSNKNKNPKISYTASLFKGGKNKCINKFKEESLELVSAFRNNNKKNIVHEAADVFYHLLVLLEFKNVKISNVMKEIKKRQNMSGIEEKENRKKK
jgi:phosphoribosyl-ATP pyrophosphohydrolase